MEGAGSALLDLGLERPDLVVVVLQTGDPNQKPTNAMYQYILIIPAKIYEDPHMSASFSLNDVLLIWGGGGRARELES